MAQGATGTPAAPIVGAGQFQFKRDSFQTVTGTSITLTSNADAVLGVTRNGIQQLLTRDYTVAPNALGQTVVTFTTALGAGGVGDDVTVLYATSSLFTASASMFRQEFMPAGGANGVSLAQPPATIFSITRDGVEQSQTDGHWSINAQNVTFQDAFDGTERVIVSFATTVGQGNAATVNGINAYPSVTPTANGLLALDANGYLIVNPGRVGIGTSAPATPLDVSGASTLRGLTNITTGGLQVLAGNIGVGVAPGAQSLTLQGDSVGVTGAGILRFVDTHASGMTWDIGEIAAAGSLAIRLINGSTNPTIASLSSVGLAVNTGTVGVGGPSSSSIGIQVIGSATSGPTQQGILSNPTGSSTATTSVEGVASLPATAAVAGFTAGFVADFRAYNPSKGAGSTITSAYGLLVDSITAGNTNNYGIVVNTPSGGTGENFAALLRGTVLVGASGIRVHRHPYGTERHIESGQHNATVGATATGSFAVLFTRPFTSPPFVVVGLDSWGGGPSTGTVWSGSTTTTGFTLFYYNSTGAAQNFNANWMAEGASTS